MIRLDKKDIKPVYLTLTEKVSLSDPAFLFLFKNEQSNEEKYFIAQDVATEEQKERFNKFNISISAAEDLLNGIIDLKLDGFYSYEVREQVSSTNLDPNESGAIVETGIVKVIGTEIDIPEFVNPDPTVKVFQKSVPSVLVGIGQQVIGTSNIIG